MDSLAKLREAVKGPHRRASTRSMSRQKVKRALLDELDSCTSSNRRRHLVEEEFRPRVEIGAARR